MRKPSSFWQFIMLRPFRVRRRRSQQTAARRLRCEHLEARNLLAADGWYNVDLPTDVNDDGMVTPVDALLVANLLYENGGNSVMLTGDNPGSVHPDVNNDLQVGMADMTAIVNELVSAAAATPERAMRCNRATRSILLSLQAPAPH